MIWPVTWGKTAGSDVLRAYLGIFPTALFLPWVAYYGVARGGSLSAMSKRVGRAFEYLFALPAMLVIGPLFTIPRMSAAAWDALSTLFGFSPNLAVWRTAFQVVYYLVAYWFLAKLSTMVDKMSKYLVPFLLVLVFAIIAKGVLDPISDWATPSYDQNPWSWGFVNGYQTSELLVALAFAGLIIADLEARGVRKGEAQVRNLMVASAIGIGMLCLTHFGHMLVGARTGDEFAGARYAALYASVVMRLWGKTGGTLFNLGLLLAALTTAIGCTAGVASYIEEFSEKKITYNQAAIGISLISVFVSSMGLAKIIQITAPLFGIIYPPAIVLTVLYCVMKPVQNAKHARVVRYTAWTSLAFGTFDALCSWVGAYSTDAVFKPGVTGVLARLASYLPGSSQGLAWMIPTAVVGFLTWIVQTASGGDAVKL